MSRKILPGRRSPLGATWDGEGVNFAIFTWNATGVELCLFDDASGDEERIPLPEVTAHVWHGYLRGIKPGQRYGYRVHGPFAPEEGLRFNPNKLLIDPYAKALEGEVDWNAGLFGYPLGHPDADLAFDETDRGAEVRCGRQCVRLAGEPPTTDSVA